MASTTWRTSRRCAHARSGSLNRFIAATVAAALAGCATGSSNGQTDAVRDTASATTRDTVRVLAQVQQSGWDAAGTVVVTDDAGYGVAWTTTHAGLSPAPTAPAVNFANASVVFVAAGMRTSGGYAVELGAVRTTIDSVVVDVIIQAPGANCSVTAALTQPAIAFAVPRSATPPVVMVRDRVGPSC